MALEIENSPRLPLESEFLSEPVGVLDGREVSFLPADESLFELFQESIPEDLEPETEEAEETASEEIGCSITPHGSKLCLGRFHLG